MKDKGTVSASGPKLFLELCILGLGLGLVLGVGLGLGFGLGPVPDLIRIKLV